MTAYDEQWLRENTPGGRHAAKLGIPARRPRDEIDADVNMVDAEYQRRFDRELTDAERRSVRIGAEMRSRTLAEYGTLELTLQDIHDLGYGFTIETKADSAGIAIANGTHWEGGQLVNDWSGDPDIIRRAQAAEMASRGRPAPSGPIRGIA